jgi:hypothetical protein
MLVVLNVHACDLNTRIPDTPAGPSSASEQFDEPIGLHRLKGLMYPPLISTYGFIKILDGFML